MQPLAAAILIAGGLLPVAVWAQAARFELVINEKTVKALCLSVPASLRLRAEKVID